jgi:hypothetical protein
MTHRVRATEAAALLAMELLASVDILAPLGCGNRSD